MRLAVDSGAGNIGRLPQGGGHYQTVGSLTKNEKAEEIGIHSFCFLPACLGWDIHPLLALGLTITASAPLLLWPSDSD